MRSPGNDLTKGPLNSCGDFGKDLGGEMKVALSPGEIHMPEVGREKGKFGIQIHTVLIPVS